LCVKWNPNPQILLIAAVTEHNLTMLYHDDIANALQRVNTEKYFENPPPNEHKEKIAKRVEWIRPEGMPP
jgi:hypothetical protein